MLIGGIGDEQRLGICRHIHDEDMADPPRVRRPVCRSVPRASARRCAGCPSSTRRRLAWRISSTALVRRRMAVRRCRRSRRTADRGRLLRDAARNLRLGPTRIGTINPASAASMAPCSEVSSHGCATTVVLGGSSFARAMRRSYFSCLRGCGPGFALAATVGLSAAAMTSSSMMEPRLQPRAQLYARLDGPCAPLRNERRIDTARRFGRRDLIRP